MARIRSPFAAPVVALVLAGCGGGGVTTKPTPDAGPPVDPATFGVTDAGPFTCGHRVLETTYTPPAGQPARTIPVHVWYPSTSTSGDHTAYIGGLFPDPLAWEDGKLAPPAWPKGYPVLVHSHGYKGFAGNSARLMCHFATHGWLAVAPEHVGNTLGDTPTTLPLSIFYERPLDMRAALDLVEHLPDEDPLAGKADLDHLGASGHSFGTYTMWALGGASFDPAVIKARCDTGDPAGCDDAGIAVFSTDLSEHRARVIIPLAGGHTDFFGASGEDTTRVPVLLMTGSLNDVGADQMLAGITGVDLTWVDVAGGCHQLYGLGNNILGDPGCAVLPDEEGFAIVDPYILAVARYHVLDERGDEVKSLTEGTKLNSPKMTFHHKAP
jgi:predicted dienelactone hydrolase